MTDISPRKLAFDERTESHLGKLHPALEPLARAFLTNAQAALPSGVTVRIISSLRTYAEQNELYAKGRTTSGNTVTNARGGHSWHNFSERDGAVAFDIGLFRGNTYLPESESYAKIGPIGEAAGLEWGGRWKSIQDKPHFQLPLEKHGITLSVARARHLAGVDIVKGTPYEHSPKDAEEKDEMQDTTPLPADTWTVQVDGKVILKDVDTGAKGSGIVRAVAHALGAVVVVDGKKKVITLEPKR